MCVTQVSRMCGPGAGVDTLGGMCSRAQCPACDRPTYRGCGAHVEQVLADVPAAERCRCNEAPRATAQRSPRGWFGRRR